MLSWPHPPRPQPAARTPDRGVLTGDTDGKPQLRHGFNDVGTTTATIRQPPTSEVALWGSSRSRVTTPFGERTSTRIASQAGGRFYLGIPAPGYLSGVSPQANAEVAGARDVIHNSSIQGFVVLGPPGAGSSCSFLVRPLTPFAPGPLFRSPPGSGPMGPRENVDPGALTFFWGASLDADSVAPGMRPPVPSTRCLHRRYRAGARPDHVP